MSKLGQLLVARGWITVQQLTRALQNQNAVGGRLGTCLLEMDAIGEDLLSRSLAEQFGVPAAGIDELRGVPEEALQLIPEKLARRCRAVPFRLAGGRLDVAMLDPRNLSCQDEIAFACGKRVKVHVLHEVRVFEALARYYREQCPSRIELLLDRLNRVRYLWGAPESTAPGMPAAGEPASAAGAPQPPPQVLSALPAEDLLAGPPKISRPPLPEPALPPTPRLRSLFGRTSAPPSPNAKAPLPPPPEEPAAPAARTTPDSSAAPLEPWPLPPLAEVELRPPARRPRSVTRRVTQALLGDRRQRSGPAANQPETTVAAGGPAAAATRPAEPPAEREEGSPAGTIAVDLPRLDRASPPAAAPPGAALPADLAAADALSDTLPSLPAAWEELSAPATQATSKAGQAGEAGAEAAVAPPGPAEPPPASTSGARQTVGLTDEERAELGVPQQAQPEPRAPRTAEQELRAVEASDLFAVEEAPVAPELRPTPAFAAPEAAALPPVREMPIAFAQLEAAFKATSDIEEVGRMLLGFLAQSFRRVALFQVARERVSGWMALGDGIDQEAFGSFSVGFDQPSVFLNLRRGSSLHIGPLPPMAAHRGLALAWGGGMPRDCLVLPVHLKDRLVTVIYADAGSRGLGRIDLEQMQRLTAATAAAFEHCILIKKRGYA
ncbi:MAG TPA: hypothetical protein VHR45_10230 [Thermoanaerobaculia bacterium]|nr:hypothetical protein [Thermoanaerobaculia bacterium]